MPQHMKRSMKKRQTGMNVPGEEGQKGVGSIVIHN